LKIFSPSFKQNAHCSLYSVFLLLDFKMIVANGLIIYWFRFIETNNELIEIKLCISFCFTALLFVFIFFSVFFIERYKNYAFLRKKKHSILFYSANVVVAVIILLLLVSRIVFFFVLHSCSIIFFSNEKKKHFNLSFMYHKIIKSIEINKLFQLA
jgi:hypothetical protein